MKVRIVNEAISFQIYPADHDFIMTTASNATLLASISSDSISSQSEHERYGYVVHNMAATTSKWRCIFCNYLIKEPIQLTECGHRACRGCFESRTQAAATDQTMTCPVLDCCTTFDRTQVGLIGERRTNKNVHCVSALVYGRQSIQARNRCARRDLLSQRSRGLPVDRTADGLSSSFIRSLPSLIAIVSVFLDASRREAHAPRMQSMPEEVFI